MADIKKYTNNQVRKLIAHVRRDLPDGNSRSNEDIDCDMTKENYSLISRGQTVKEINNYRKEIEKKIFKYNRKGLVHAVSVCIQQPDDLSPEMQKEFFECCQNYLIEEYGVNPQFILESCVHVDEHHYVNNVDISKAHLHFTFIPAVETNEHEGYEWKLCGKHFTSLPQMRRFHSGLQSYLTQHGINATVYNPKKSGGKVIPLSVDQLKVLSTNGITLDHSLTVDELSKLINENHKYKQINEQYQKVISDLKTELVEKDMKIESLSVEHTPEEWRNNFWNKRSEHALTICTDQITHENEIEY